MRGASYFAFGFLLFWGIGISLIAHVTTTAVGKEDAFEAQRKKTGLAVLVGVGRCHEMGIGEGLVSHLTFEATLGARLAFCLQSFGLFAEHLGIPV
jgi:hypothetical protein